MEIVHFVGGKVCLRIRYLRIPWQRGRCVKCRIWACEMTHIVIKRCVVTGKMLVSEAPGEERFSTESETYLIGLYGLFVGQLIEGESGGGFLAQEVHVFDCAHRMYSGERSVGQKVVMVGLPIIGASIQGLANAQSDCALRGLL